MQNKREILLMISGAVVLLLLIVMFYALFQQERIYRSTMVFINENYRNDEGRIYKSKVPYEKFSSDKLFRWDAAHYLTIKESGYKVSVAGGDFIFAFFPLFPFAWRLSGLTAVQVSLINYFLWIISLIILTRLLINKKTKYTWRYVLVLAGVPLLAVFLIPYSEGLFMICMTIALGGLFKNKYAVYFTGALLASMTRSSVMVFGLALLFTEMYFFFQHHHAMKSIQSFARMILPLIIGTALVSLIQYSYGSDHPLKFIEVEKYWGYKLQVPHGISDWAQEQFSSNLPMVLVVFPIILAFLGFNTFRNLFVRYPVDKTQDPSLVDNNSEYLFILSMIYTAGIILTMLLFRGGSLNGISRYAGCTPFFVIILITLRNKVGGINPKSMKLIFLTAAIVLIVAMSVIRYSRDWNFSDLGFIMYFFQIAFFTFTNLISNRWMVATFVLLTAFWTSYLFSMFISNAWIIT